jgi:hypothetical protein
MSTIGLPARYNPWMMWPFNRPALDPARTAAARHDFDVVRGFDSYAAHCRAVAPRDLAPGELAARGVDLMPILPKARASEALSALLVAQTGKRSNDKGIDYSEALELTDDALLPLLDETLGAADTAIAGHFGSEYLICSLGVSRTLPVSGARRSFLWHCDRGPRRFLKVLLYLNEGHGGNTEFLDRATTAEFEALGYVFGPNRRRLADLSRLARKFGILHTPLRWPIRTGDALLFEPASVLHRGIMPTTGERYMLSLMLLPSPVPWQGAWGLMPPRRDGVFPERANDVLSALQ